MGRILKDLGFLVVDADVISRKAVKIPKALSQIEKEFGKKYIEDGELNRLSYKRIFSHPEDRKSSSQLHTPNCKNIYANN